MEKSVTFDVTPNVDAEYEAAIDQYLNEMEHMKTQMAEKQRRIETLQAETQAMLAELKVA